MQLTGPNCNSLRKTGVCPKFLGYQDVIPILMDFVKGHGQHIQSMDCGTRTTKWLGSSQWWGSGVIWSWYNPLDFRSPLLTSYIQLLLAGAKRREWMGCWGLLGLLIVSQWIIPFPTFSTSKKTCEKNKHVLGHSNTQEDAKKSDSKSVINFVSIFWGWHITNLWLGVSWDIVTNEWEMVHE